MYFEPFVDDNMTYSVDMLRLKSYISYTQFNDLEFFIKTYYSDKVKKFWFSDRLMCFKYNYSICWEEGKSFYFGFHCNNEKPKDYKESVYNFTIEFNPNKLKDNFLLLHILNISNDWYLRSLDLAIDLKINILDLIYDMSGRLKSKVISYGYDNKTIYLGEGNGRIKIYNKKIESNLYIPNDLTRVEVSYEFDDFRIMDMKLFNLPDFFPIIYTNDYLYSFSDYKDKTLFAILFAVQSGFPIKDLSRTYKDKIKKLLNGGHKIRFKKKCAMSAITRCIYRYLVNVNRFH